MKMGFTGTRTGMTWAQFAGVVKQLSDATELHHGGCVGSDAEIHEACLPWITIELYPATGTLRAYCQGAMKIHEVKPPLVRNRLIVDSVERLVAAPKGDEIKRSGTWATIRYAIKTHVSVRIVMPNGSVIHR